MGKVGATERMCRTMAFSFFFAPTSSSPIERELESRQPSHSSEFSKSSKLKSHTLVNSILSVFLMGVMVFFAHAARRIGILGQSPFHRFQSLIISLTL